MLTVKNVESSKLKERPYKLTDYGSLYLYITPSGTKSWHFDYQFNGKLKTLTIGKYPLLSLTEARQERDLKVCLSMDVIHRWSRKNITL